MPDELVDESWERFRTALEPLRAAGRLGAVFFQFPPWFFPSSRSLAYIEQCQERMFGFQVAVEFRKPEWMDARHRDGTLAFLRTRDIPDVAVDVPQGHNTSMPPEFEVTSCNLAVCFHGRNREPGTSGAPNLRFDTTTDETWPSRSRDQGDGEVGERGARDHEQQLLKLLGQERQAA
jgi:uncharacterized protein YecE (DUF72 family)